METVSLVPAADCKGRAKQDGILLMLCLFGKGTQGKTLNTQHSVAQESPLADNYHYIEFHTFWQNNVIQVLLKLSSQ